MHQTFVLVRDISDARPPASQQAILKKSEIGPAIGKNRIWDPGTP